MGLPPSVIPEAAFLFCPGNPEARDDRSRCDDHASHAVGGLRRHRMSSETSNRNGLERDDAMAYGVEGLIQAVDNYDPSVEPASPASPFDG